MGESRQREPESRKGQRACLGLQGGRLPTVTSRFRLQSSGDRLLWTSGCPSGEQPPVWLCGCPLGEQPPVWLCGCPSREQPPVWVCGCSLGNSPPCGYMVAPWGTALPCEQVLQGNRPPVPHSREPSRQAPPGSCPGCRPLLSQRRARTAATGPAGAGPGLVTRGCSHPQALGDKGGHVPKPARGRRWCGAARRVDTPPACSPREPGRAGPP